MVNKNHEGSNGTDRNPPSGTDSHGVWHGGKGSVQNSNNQDKYAENYDKIFGKKKTLSQREKVLMDPLAASQRSDNRKKNDER